MNLIPLAATAALSLSLLVAAPGDAVTREGASPSVQRSDSLPRIPYAYAAHPRFEQGDWKLIQPNGHTHRLSRATWSQFVTRGRTAIGAYATEGEPGYIVERVGAKGHVVRIHGGDGGFGFVTTPDKTIVGWPSDDGGVLTLGTDGKQIQLPPVPIPKGSETPVVEAILGSKTCKEDYPEGGGCAAYVGQPGLAKVWITTSHGIVQRVPHIAEVKDASRGRLIGPVPGMGEQQCSGLLGPAYRRVWRTCDTDLQRFSPGGKYVVGTAPHFNSHGVIDGGTVEVYTATHGHVVSGWFLGGTKGDLIDDVVWEDATHLLVTKWDGHAWTMLRLTVATSSDPDGDGVETVIGPLAIGTADSSPFNLPIR